MTSLRTMTDAEYQAWIGVEIPAYAAEKVASGQWAEGEALARSRQEHDELLPRGLATPDNHLFTVIDASGSAVGVLWYAVTTRFEARVAYLYDIAIDPQHQRQGHGERTLLALEDEVRGRGLSGIALHVFGHNSGARALYEKLGFTPTNINLFKRVV